MIKRFIDRFSGSRIPGLSFVGSPSLARQEFLGECDMNTIVRRYLRTGSWGEPLSSRVPMFGDFSTGNDFRNAMSQIADVTSRFNDLPSDVRKRFENDPSLMLDFMSNPDNELEARKLGLINPIFEEIPSVAPEVKPEITD